MSPAPSSWLHSKWSSWSFPAPLLSNQNEPLRKCVLVLHRQHFQRLSISLQGKAKGIVTASNPADFTYPSYGQPFSWSLPSAPPATLVPLLSQELAMCAPASGTLCLLFPPSAVFFCQMSSWLFSWGPSRHWPSHIFVSSSCPCHLKLKPPLCFLSCLLCCFIFQKLKKLFVY